MDMDRLIVYCRAVAYKKNEISDDCCEMYSFNESNITDLITAQSRGLSFMSHLLNRRNLKLGQQFTIVHLM